MDSRSFLSNQKKETAVKTAFFAAVIFGLMTHLYQFTNKLYNYDELANTPGGNGASVEQGRWFLKWMGDLLLKHFGGVYSLPLLNGVLSLLLLAISAAMIVEMFEVAGIDTQIICASVRHPIHVTECALAGADIATVPYKVLEQMTKHPLTDAGIEKFQKDYKAVFGDK